MLDLIVIPLAIAALEVLVVSVLVKRTLAKRDANRWMPFRRYLLQVLHDESLNEMKTANDLSSRLKSRIDADHTPESWQESIQEILKDLERAVAALRASRHSVHQAIQTAAPSLTSEAAVNFANIFRALDNGPILVTGLAKKLKELSSPERPELAVLEQQIGSARTAVSAESIKLLGGISYLVRDVESLLEQHNYVVIDGLVSTPEDVRRRKHVEAIAGEAKKRFAELSTK